MVYHDIIMICMGISWYTGIMAREPTLGHGSRAHGSRLVTVAGALPVGTMPWPVSSRLVTVMSRGLTAQAFVARYCRYVFLFVTNRNDSNVHTRHKYSSCEPTRRN